jgi:hypothetical protein
MAELRAKLITHASRVLISGYEPPGTFTWAGTWRVAYGMTAVQSAGEGPLTSAYPSPHSKGRGTRMSGSPLDTSWEKACVHRSRRCWWHLTDVPKRGDEDEPHCGRRRRTSPPQRSRRTQRKSGRGTVDGECRLALDPASTPKPLEREAGVVAGDLGSFCLHLRVLRALRGDPSDDRSGRPARLHLGVAHVPGAPGPPDHAAEDEAPELAGMIVRAAVESVTPGRTRGATSC